jgi:hypothetical protein
LSPGDLEEPPVGGGAEALDVVAQDRDEHRRDGDDADGVAGAVLELALVDGGAVVGPGGADAFRGPGQGQPAPAFCRHPGVTAA